MNVPKDRWLQYRLCREAIGHGDSRFHALSADSLMQASALIASPPLRRIMKDLAGHSGYGASDQKP